MQPMFAVDPIYSLIHSFIQSVSLYVIYSHMKSITNMLGYWLLLGMSIMVG